MKDEIKEILDDLLFTTTLPNVSVKLSEEKLYQLKDYITNLQEENERLEKNQRFHKNGVFSLEYDKETLCDMVEELQQENENLKDQIEMIVKDLKGRL